MRGFGAAAGALKVARELELAEAIDRALGGRHGKPSVGEMICLAAINRAVCPRSKRQLGDWHQRTVLARLLPYPVRALSSQRFWDAMHLLTNEAIARAETEIVQRAIERYRVELEPLVFDKGNNSQANQALADELGLGIVGSLTEAHHLRERELGKRLIFTDRHHWQDEQILAAYRAQSKAERAFRQMKDTQRRLFDALDLDQLAPV